METEINNKIRSFTPIINHLLSLYLRNSLGEWAGVLTFLGCMLCVGDCCDTGGNCGSCGECIMRGDELSLR